MVTGSWKLECGFQSRLQWRVMAGAEQPGRAAWCFHSECGPRCALNPLMLDEAEKH